MRDPDGALRFEADHIARTLADASPSAGFLRSGAARSLIDQGLIVPFRFAADHELHATRIPFVSHPFEWCDAQLASAARLTLEISRSLLDSLHELKDASAWNVIFVGTKPLFCDLLSFRSITRREWWAFGQFARHFALPLAVSHEIGLHAHRAFAMSRDGMDVATARSLLGVRRYFSRYWPMTLEFKGAPAATTKPAAAPSPEAIGGFRRQIYRYCEFSIPKRSRSAKGSDWSAYVSRRAHYVEGAAERKREVVEQWLRRLRPVCVVDLGCNTGEYARLAATCGAERVIAIDFDHDSIEALFVAERSGTVVHPVICDISDIAGGRGWMGEESPGLIPRLAGAADVLICLALIHHLAVSESVPLAQVSRLLAALTRGHALVELIESTDPMLSTLAANRDRDPAEFSIARQLDALALHFDIEARERIVGTDRELCLLRLRTRGPSRQ